MLRACLAVLGAAECSWIHRFLLQIVCKNPRVAILFFRITCTDKLNREHASTSQNGFLTKSKQPSLEMNSEQINPFLSSCPSYVPASETTALPPGDSASGPWDKGLLQGVLGLWLN